MKLPALAIAAAFASGIAVGLTPAIAHHASSHLFLDVLLIAAGTSLLTGVFLTFFERCRPAGFAAMLCWFSLGTAAICIEEQPRAAGHILSFVDAGKINLKSPLRFYGRLRGEPEKLPWGTGYDIELSGVEPAGGSCQRKAVCGSVTRQGLIKRSPYLYMPAIPFRS
jgi:hypothetical protein